VVSLPERFNAADYFIDRHVREGRGSNIAIECGDEYVTYQQLAERIDRVGSALRARCDVRIEERVLLLLLDTPAFPYCFFGALKIGAVPVPVNTQWKPSDYRYVLNDSRARVAIVSESLLPHLHQIPPAELDYLQHVIVAGHAPHGTVSLATLLESGSGALVASDTSRDDVAFWLYSSGSTGPPKGCVHLQHDMVVCAELYARGILGITEKDRCFSVAKLFFAYGLGNAMYMPFSVGATAILFPGVPAAADVYATIERHRPTLFFSVPTGYAMMLAHQRQTAGSTDFDLASVRHAVSAGEALPPALFDRFKRRFGIEILDGIGSTETLHMFISNRPGAVRPGSSGLIIDGYEARILDDQKHAVQTGEIGNLYIKGDSICACYWNQHARTTDTIEGRWIRTGDRFRQDADGFFWYSGRADDMLKVGGQWVSPVEIENALIRHDAVQQCAVVGHADADSLVKPFAFVVVRPGVPAGPSLARELQDFVRAELADYKRPRWVEFLSELPTTPTGKIQRFKLREAIARS
jgi:benzoate-CoA ligase family protein